MTGDPFTHRRIRITYPTEMGAPSAPAGRPHSSGPKKKRARLTLRWPRPWTLPVAASLLAITVVIALAFTRHTITAPGPETRGGPNGSTDTSSLVDSSSRATAHHPNPKLADSFYELGRARMALGQMVPALYAFSEAVELNPGHVAARVALGSLLLANHQYRAAHEQAVLALRADPSSAAAASLLAQSSAPPGTQTPGDPPQASGGGPSSGAAVTSGGGSAAPGGTSSTSSGTSTQSSGGFSQLRATTTTAAPVAPQSGASTTQTTQTAAAVDPPPQCPPCQLQLLNSVHSRHGNAGRLVWSDDGKTVFLANDEGVMSAVKIDATDPSAPRLAAMNGDVNYLWAAAQKGGLLVYHASVSGDIIRIDPQTFATVWQTQHGGTHALATDGSRIFVGDETRQGSLGWLQILDSAGNNLQGVGVPEGWAGVFTTVYDASTQRVYVTSAPDASQNSPGGIYIFDVSSNAPAYLGKLPSPGYDFAVLGHRLWRQNGAGMLEAWDVTDPRNPRILGTFTGPTQTDDKGASVPTNFGYMVVNSSGTRLYVNYEYRQVNFRADLPAGFMIFDVSGTAPVLLQRQDWPLPYYREEPMSVALSPDGATLAVSYWTFGVRFYRVTNDQVAPLGLVPTTGEARDVYVDNTGLLHIFAVDSTQIMNPQTGNMVNVIPHPGKGVEGGWKPFADGSVILRGEPPTVLNIHDGVEDQRGTVLDALPTYIWDNYFEAPYLYSGAENGTLYIHRIGAFNGEAYPFQLVGSATAPIVSGQQGAPFLMGVTKIGNTVWALGPSVGIVAFDVTNPAAPTLVFHDPVTFHQNGGHVGIVATQGRVYAGAGDAGVIIYDPVRFARTGAISGLNVNFLDLLDQQYLIVANYWYPQLPDGTYVYALRPNPDAPVLVDHFPKPQASSNFRVRVFGQEIFRVPLYGVDILQLH